MTRVHLAILVAAMLTASFLGGASAVLLLDSGSVSAGTDRQHIEHLTLSTLRVVDKQGAQRAFFGMEEGDPLFVMENTPNQPGVCLGASEAGGMITLMRPAEKSGGTAPGGPAIMLCEPKSKEVVWQAP